MSQVTRVDVAVAGAGIAGLAAAVALSRLGYRVAILEAASRPQLSVTGETLDGWDRRVSALTPATCEFLEQLGVWPRIAAERVGPYVDMHVWDAEGTGRIDFSATEVGAPLLGHIVENRRIIDALLVAAETTPGIDLYWQTPLETLDAGPDGEVLLGSEALPETLTASLLIGADGGRSRVRELADFEVRRWSYEQQAIVATVELADTHQSACWQAFLPTGPLALLPLAPANLCSIVWSLDDRDCERWLDATSADFVAGLNRAMGAVGPEVTRVSERQAFPLVQCHAVDYVQPGIALVADAAHSIHPLAGQGINLGLADVRVLAAELERAREAGLNPGDGAVLRRYQRQRKGENLTMMAAMEAFKRGFGADSPLIRVARNAGLDWVNQMAPLKQWFIRQALR
jgi:2-octaprenylphenol hydroxylase